MLSALFGSLSSTTGKNKKRERSESLGQLGHGQAETKRQNRDEYKIISQTHKSGKKRAQSVEASSSTKDSYNHTSPRVSVVEHAQSKYAQLTMSSITTGSGAPEEKALWLEEAGHTTDWEPLPKRSGRRR